MNDIKINIPKEYELSEELLKVVTPETPLKELILNYVGNKLNPENEDITVDMIVEVFAEEFPEFILGICEENYLRGYKEAIDTLSAKNEK